ncbi:ribonuclease E/G [Kordiimonas aquimaris]|uniref:ribonuclease E/G n=1 Tax=Kordiimonas aquimaris TaxID=707591 RepID=UPI0021D14340|nr:ribonuclease E/G [Kordiimonas aquimaris]
MTNASLTIIEPGIGQWRSADIDTNDGDDGLPTDLRFHDDVSLSPLDSVFAARITHIDTANDLAFADLGEGLTGCMNLRRAKSLVKGKANSINDCVTEGMRLLVQVVSEPSTQDDKALVITPRPRLMGRYVVIETGGARLNFSKDIGPAKVKKLTPELGACAENAVIIVRSRAANTPTEAITEEAKLLVQAINSAADKPGVVFSYTPLEKALIAIPDDSTQVLIEGGSAFASAAKTCAKRWPDVHERLSQYKGTEPAFEYYGVNEAIEEALAERIMLPSGGWISITPTPAMTVVDVNMGNAFKGRSASDAKVIVNMEAALAVLYHLRFQDIGGLVVVDFIDMTAKGAAKELIQLIEKVTREDRVPVQHTGISTFGLVEFARKRSGLSLRDRMQVSGLTRTRVQAAMLDLLRRALQAGQAPQPGTLVIAGPEPLLAWLKAHPHYSAELTAMTQRTVELMLGTTPDVFLRNT